MRSVRHGGFSLIEVLVAFTILSLALTTILALFATTLRSTAIADGYIQAVTLAEARMAELQATDFNQMAAQTGEGIFAERFHWRSAVRPLDDASSGVAGVGLFVLSTEVRWREATRERQVALSTIRIGRLP